MYYQIFCLFLFSFILSISELRADNYQNHEIKSSSLEEKIESLSHELKSIRGDSVYQDENFEEQFSILENHHLGLKDENYVNFEDISTWQEIKPHYAAGYDPRGKLLAIYDLSYQNPLSGEFIGRSVLGTIGVGDLNIRDIIKMISEALKRNEAEIQSSFSSNKKTESEKFIKKNKKILTKILEELDDEKGEVHVSLKKNWWKDIKWKESFNKNLSKDKSSKPISFKLSDIDIESDQNFIEKYRFKKAIEKIVKLFQIISNNEKINKDNVLSLFEYKTNGDEINLYMSKNALVSIFDNDRPNKVIDFIHYKNSLGTSFMRLIYKIIIKRLARSIPEPTVSTIVSYAVNRWFCLYDQQKDFHGFKALELVNLAAKNSKSTFSFLDNRQLTKAGVYIQSHEANFISLFFKDRDEDYWLESMEEEDDNIDLNIDWSLNKGLKITHIGSSFYSANKVQKNSLLMFGDQKRFSNKPFTAIDYESPHSRRINRNFAFAVRDLLETVDFQIPFASILIEELYDVFVIDDLEKSQRMESRLSSFLLLEGKDQYSKELDLIYKQRVNPFEFDLEEEEKFIKRSKAYIGM